ncbi:MAG: sporulation protein YqfC [Bacillota bacterium]
MRLREVHQKIKRKAVDALELPGDVALDLPKIVITGNVHVLIENHRGIVAYSPDAVKVLVQVGEVVVSGRNLVIRSIAADEVAVEGEIQGVTFS